MYVPQFSTLTDEQKRELWALLALQHTHFFDSITIKKMVEFYKTAHNAIKALANNPTAWREIGIRKEAIANFLSERWLNMARNIWTNLAESPDVSILLITDAQYPELLRAIDNPPPVLYALGDTTLLHTPSVAIVGNRKASTAGKNFTYNITQELTTYGFSIISGLAEGIDTSAHTAALDIGGKTIAVLAHGLHTVYPAKNKALFENIAQKGCLITEYPPGTPPKQNHFPIRNRIISALSLGILVTEARLQSGSLTTVRIGLEQGKTIFAIPNTYTSPHSSGTAYLIAEGATPVHCAEELFVELLPQISIHKLPENVQQALHAYHLSLYETKENYYDKFLASLPENTSIPHQQTSQVNVMPSCISEQIQKHSSSTAEQGNTKQSTNSFVQDESVNTASQTTFTKLSEAQQAPQNITTSIQDILNIELSSAGNIILKTLYENEADFDTLIIRTNLTPAILSRELIMLEIQGAIKKYPNGIYSKV